MLADITSMCVPQPLAIRSLEWTLDAETDGYAGSVMDTERLIVAMADLSARALHNQTKISQNNKNKKKIAKQQIQ